jgi:hypothetical protein
MSDLPILVWSMVFLKNWTVMSDSVTFDLVIQWEEGGATRAGNLDLVDIAETISKLAGILPQVGNPTEITITRHKVDKNANTSDVRVGADGDAVSPVDSGISLRQGYDSFWGS